MATDYNFPVVGGSNFQRSAAADSQLAVNWYPYYDPMTQQWSQYFYAGAKKFLTPDVGENPFYGRCGGCLALIDSAYFVLGNKVFEINSIFTITEIGTINTVVGTVCMCVGGSYLLVVDGTGGWVYNVVTHSGWEQTLGFGPGLFPISPSTCAEQEGYFLVNDVGTQQCYQSKFEDPTVWNAINRFPVNYNSCAAANPLIAIRSVNSRMLMFSRGFIQVYTRDPVLSLAFEPDQNLVFSYGILSQAAIVVGTSGSYSERENQFAIFISQTTDGTRKIMKTSAEPPTIISTPSVDYRLNQLTAPEECESFIWTENGQTFAVFNFKTDAQTIVYNVTNKTFFDLKYTNDNRYFGQSFMFFRNKKLLTSYLDGFVYELSEDFLDNAGLPMRRLRITDNFRVAGYKNIQANHLELYFQQGVGLVGRSDPNGAHYVYGADPEVYLYISYDGGQSFSEPMRQTLGLSGRRMTTTRFESLGYSKDWTFKLEIMAPVPVFLMGANFNYTVASGSG